MASIARSMLGGLNLPAELQLRNQGKLRRRAIHLEYFTVTWNILEALVALVAGWLASSIALQGFGLDSVIETVSGLTLLWRFRQSRPPGDEDHAELRAVQVVGVTFFALAAYVGYEAGADLRFRRAPHFSLPGIILAALSLILMPFLALAKRRVARALKSRALAADSLQTLLCSYLSATLLLGLALNGWLGWWWADPIAALAMAAFMVREGLEALSG
jgi:divalent metal cation (Fe/Co/Zn/Cd) transporter